MKRAALIGAVLALALTTAGGGSRAALGPALEAIDEAIDTMDFDRAHALVDAADTGDPRVGIERARLALYELRCDDAVAMFGRTELAHSEAASYLGDIARGCARVTAGTITERDAASGVEVTWQDENDRALGPILIDTVVKAQAALTRDLGLTWTKPMRVVVVRDLMSLSAMTGLEYKDASTTGTVAIAKWGRVTILSPRASRHGFAWRDTMAHELTHLAVTRITADRAPLWLQEGVAKREEIRWREPGPFDYRPSPESVVAKGIELKLDLPLDKLGRSIAMLPSADRAAVAFAEVTSFVRYFADNADAARGRRRGGGVVSERRSPGRAAAAPPRDPRQGRRERGAGRRDRGRLRRLGRQVARVARGAAAGPAPRDVGSRRRSARPPRAAGAGPPGRAPPGARPRRRRAERARPGPGDRVDRREPPALARARHGGGGGACRRRGRAAGGAQGRGQLVRPVVGDPRARMARVKGDPGVAESYFLEAVGQDPFDVESACQSLEATASPADPKQVPLCNAARAVGDPGIGED